MEGRGVWDKDYHPVRGRVVLPARGRVVVVMLHHLQEWLTENCIGPHFEGDMVGVPMMALFFAILDYWTTWKVPLLHYLGSLLSQTVSLDHGHLAEAVRSCVSLGGLL